MSSFLYKSILLRNMSIGQVSCLIERFCGKPGHRWRWPSRPN
uniref:Uncharacterized protein n=1 Tax=Anguilla anguilla TaxID=7936 RepID=A0A0E9T2N7_ANGAN